MDQQDVFTWDELKIRWTKPEEDIGRGEQPLSDLNLWLMLQEMKASLFWKGINGLEPLPAKLTLADVQGIRIPKTQVRRIEDHYLERKRKFASLPMPVGYCPCAPLTIPVNLSAREEELRSPVSPPPPEKIVLLDAPKPKPPVEEAKPVESSQKGGWPPPLPKTPQEAIEAIKLATTLGKPTEAAFYCKWLKFFLKRQRSQIGAEKENRIPALLEKINSTLERQAEVLEDRQPRAHPETATEPKVEEPTETKTSVEDHSAREHTLRQRYKDTHAKVIEDAKKLKECNPDFNAKKIANMIHDTLEKRQVSFDTVYRYVREALKGQISKGRPKGS